MSSGSLEKDLAERTLIKRSIYRNFVPSGIRELDEMIGGGFRPGTLTLFQQDLGCGGDIIFAKIIEPQLALSNVVLVILSDPTAAYLAEELERLKCDNLFVLDLVQMSKKNINMVYDKHEISLKIRDARNRAYMYLEKLRKEDPELELFTFFVSFNPFVLNLSRDNVLRILHDNLIECIDKKTVDLILLNKDILNKEMLARIQSLCHGVIDLRSYFEGVHKKNEIRILKMIGRLYDVKIEPYTITFDEKSKRTDFIIKSAFLTSFETFRNLLGWNKGALMLSKEPYIMVPVNYINSLMEMPYNIDRVKGRNELLEKAQGIGRNLTYMVERLYFVEGLPLFRATLQTASLLGWGHAVLVDFEPEENLITLTHDIHKNFNQKIYIQFLEGFYRGIVKRALRRDTRYIKINRVEPESGSEGRSPEIITYNVRIRLKRKERTADESEF